MILASLVFLMSLAPTLLGCEKKKPGAIACVCSVCLSVCKHSSELEPSRSPKHENHSSLTPSFADNSVFFVYQWNSPMSLFSFRCSGCLRVNSRGLHLQRVKRKP